MQHCNIVGPHHSSPSLLHSHWLQIMSTMQNGCVLHSGAVFTLEQWQKEGTHCHAHIRLLRGWIGALTRTLNDIIIYRYS